MWPSEAHKAEDGTWAHTPDTVANQSEYPQPSSQVEGGGFPGIQLIGLIELGHGELRDFWHSEIITRGLRGHDQLEALAADRFYSSYEVVARLQQRGVEFIRRNHQARKCDFRHGNKLGPSERIQAWKKPRKKPALSRLCKEEWTRLPDQMEMRIIRIKGPDRKGKRTTRYVVTKLLDAGKHPWDEVASLFVHRWEIELRFRDVKTTMAWKCCARSRRK